MSSNLQLASIRDLTKASEYYHQGDTVNGKAMWVQGSIESCGTIVASEVARNMSVIKGNNSTANGRDYFNDTNGYSSTPAEKALAIDLYLLSRGITTKATQTYAAQAEQELSLCGQIDRGIKQVVDSSLFQHTLKVSEQLGNFCTRNAHILFLTLVGTVLGAALLTRASQGKPLPTQEQSILNRFSYMWTP